MVVSVIDKSVLRLIVIIVVLPIFDDIHLVVVVILPALVIPKVFIFNAASIGTVGTGTRTLNVVQIYLYGLSSDRMSDRAFFNRKSTLCVWFLALLRLVIHVV